MLNKYRVNNTEFQNFFKALEEDGNEKIRLFCLLSLMTGLTVSEIISLKFDDIDEKNSKLTFTSNKLRSGEQCKTEVSLTPSVLAELKKEKALNPTDIYIFQSNNSNNVKTQIAKPFTRRAVNSAFSQANKKIGSSITPSKLRQIYFNKFSTPAKIQGFHCITKTY